MAPQEITTASVDLDNVAGTLAQARRLKASVSRVLSEFDAREDHWRIMQLLGNHREGMLMGELAAQSALPRSSVTRAIDELCDGGMAFRRTDSEDGRTLIAQLSRYGAERLELLNEALRARLTSN